MTGDPNPFAIEHPPQPGEGEHVEQPNAEEFAPAEADGDVESLTNDQMLDEARQATPEERLHILQLLREEGEIDMNDPAVRHRWMAAALEARTLGGGSRAWSRFLQDPW